MEGKFFTAADVRRDDVGWGSLAWLSSPAASGFDQIVAVEVTFHSGEGHDFHKHPRQEELIYVLEGEVEQWIGLRSRLMAPGDSAVIPAGTVHASFARSSGGARILAVLGPSVGEEGYEVVALSDREPWASLR